MMVRWVSPLKGFPSVTFKNQEIISSFCFFLSILAFFQCYVCHASVSVEIDRGRISEPALCRNCNTNHSMVLIHNRSQYTDKQITKLQESPGDCIIYCFSKFLKKVKLTDYNISRMKLAHSNLSQNGSCVVIFLPVNQR